MPWRFPGTDDPWRGPDVTWQEVREALGALLADSQIEPGVEEVAQDYCHAIDSRILRISMLPDPEHVEALAKSGVELLLRIAAKLEHQAGATVYSRPSRHGEWVGMYLRLPPSAGLEPLLWLYVIPKGGKYNLFGQGDAVCVWAMQAKDKRFAHDGRVLRGCFERKLDISGYKWERLDFELPASGWNTYGHRGSRGRSLSADRSGAARVRSTSYCALSECAARSRRAASRSFESQRSGIASRPWRAPSNAPATAAFVSVSRPSEIAQSTPPS